MRLFWIIFLTIITSATTICLPTQVGLGQQEQEGGGQGGRGGDEDDSESFRNLPLPSLPESEPMLEQEVALSTEVESSPANADNVDFEGELPVAPQGAEIDEIGPGEQSNLNSEVPPVGAGVLGSSVSESVAAGEILLPSLPPVPVDGSLAEAVAASASNLNGYALSPEARKVFEEQAAYFEAAARNALDPDSSSVGPATGAARAERERLAQLIAFEKFLKQNPQLAAQYRGAKPRSERVARPGQ